MKTGCWELVLFPKPLFKRFQRIGSAFAPSRSGLHFLSERNVGNSAVFAVEPERSSPQPAVRLRAASGNVRGENRKKELRITGWLVEELARWKRVLPGPGPQRGTPSSSTQSGFGWKLATQRLADSGRNAAAAGSGPLKCRKSKPGV